MPTQDLRDERPAARVPWHALPMADVLARLDATGAGLSAAEASARLARTGPNVLDVAPTVSAWRILWRQFAGVVVLLLVAAGVVAGASGDVAVAVAIGAVLALNVAIGFGTELRARRATDALRRLDVPRAVVLRDGRAVTLDAHALVPGDIIELEAGQAVPADARLVQATALRTSEALLSGESLPVEKSADHAMPAERPLPERRNMIYRATTVVAGAARAVVVGTGMATEIGRIGALVSAVPDEPTPIERRLDALGRRLALAAIGVGILVGGFEGWRHADLRLLLQTALAVAVAAVPEGLPAVVTIAMAVGVWRMSRRGVLVRRLPAVESLGSATVICVDKTGTVTAGVQTVTTLWLPPREIRVTGTAYEPAGEFLEGDTPLVAADDPALALALRTGALANRAGIEHEGGEWSARGDPTDVALLVAARKAGFDRAALVAHLPEVGEHPFSSERMLMATFHATGEGAILAHVKGAPTALYALCDRVLAGGREEPASAEWERRVADRSAALGARGLRVLGLAAGSAGSPSLDSLSGLTFIGLVGMTDPPAPGVRETIARLRGAGIRTVMLTGDQQATAQAVAAELGVADVVSRITPEGKVRVVAELRDSGHIVAMLGDGVNDAPALRRADIGVAMGTRGTDVAKEAAGIILRDDRLETVVAAVEEGRVVYDNIRRFVFYLFSCNLAEIIALLGAGALGLPLPMTPLQILYLNLVTDTIPALALALEPAGRHIMTRPPRDPRAAILSPGLLRLTALYAVLIAAITLIALAWGLRTGPHEPVRAVTMSFTTLALAQLFHLGNARSEEHVLTPRRIFANRFAIGAIVLSLAAQAAAVMLPGLSRVLGTQWLSARDWLVALVLSLVPAVVGQAWKVMVPPRAQTAAGPPQNRTRDPSTRRSPG